MVIKHNWSLDKEVVEEEVEQFNVKRCIAHGWTSYITADAGGGVPVPLSQAASPQEQKRLAAVAEKARKLWSGVKTISDWIESDSPSVPREQSELRAASCVQCPFNGKGDLTSWFAVPAAAAIKRQIERVQQKNLSTSLDDKLGVCAEKDGPGGCLCVNRVSVHVPIEFKLRHLQPEVKAQLHKDCWVLREEKELQTKAA